MPERSPYPSIEDYAFISGLSSAALVSRSGSIDWCCMPRFDTGSCFGRLMDWQQGGYTSIMPKDEQYESSRRYLEGTLILETTFWSSGGEARLLDCFTLTEGHEGDRHRLLRIVEGVRGQMDLVLNIVPRFDYGEVKPWIRQHGVRFYSATGGNDGLVISGDPEIRPSDRHELEASIFVRAGERARVSLEYVPPERIDTDLPAMASNEELDNEFEQTVEWWRKWSARCSLKGTYGPGAVLSASVLQGLTYAPSGAMAAAATTSLPESLDGSRNWDYRYSWIRDSTFAVRSLAELGYEEEADRFRLFIGRSGAGSAEGLQIMYGVGGERRLNQVDLDHLEGYRGLGPVRAGNAAYKQLQLGVYGEVLDLAWRWHRRGQSPNDEYWIFLRDLVDMACERWQEADRGIWEMPDKPRHFVHSKAMCWAALNRGISLSEECYRRAPVERWRKAKRRIREAIESEGYDSKRGVFVQAFDNKVMDSALLLLPVVEFITYDDERMVRTVDAIRQELGRDGLLLRYDPTEDDLGGQEGVFLACSFWLCECLVHQDRINEAREVYNRALSTANDLGLFSEEYDTDTHQMLGNFPQGLTHLSHIAAAVTLENA